MQAKPVAALQRHRSLDIGFISSCIALYAAVIYRWRPAPILQHCLADVLRCRLLTEAQHLVAAARDCIQFRQSNRVVLRQRSWVTTWPEYGMSKTTWSSHEHMHAQTKGSLEERTRCACTMDGLERTKQVRRLEVMAMHTRASMTLSYTSCVSTSICASMDTTSTPFA